MRSAAVLGVALSLAIGAIGCSGAEPGPAVVRVGRAAIDEQTVGHWASAISRGAIVANVAASGESARGQALALLIYSHWLIGEAESRGLRPSRRQLERLIGAQERAMPNGHDEFEKLLAASGETLADVEFEARARWAAETLAVRLDETVKRRSRAQVSSAAIASFYRMHAARYHLRERRYYDLIERLPSRAAATALARKLGTGARFAARSSKERPFRPRTFAGLPGQRTVYRAVFAAKVGVLTGPLPLQGAYGMFVLRRIEPPRVQSLAEVRAAIERQMLASAERRARAQLIGSFRKRWIARTDCRGGYVVQKCRRYPGPFKPEHDPLAGF